MMKGYYISDDEYITEEEFVWSFSSTGAFYEYLIDSYNEHGEIEINTLKQMFLNQDRQCYYAECIKFEEIYLK